MGIVIGVLNVRRSGLIKNANSTCLIGQTLRQDLEKDPLVAAAAPMIQTFGMVTFPDGRSKTVAVRGIEGQSFARVTKYDELLWWRHLDKPLPKDAKGEVAEFDIDPRLIEQFASDLGKAVKSHIDRGEAFALVTAPEARPYVRMIVDRLYPNIPVLSHVEISRGVNIEVMGAIS